MQRTPTRLLTAAITFTLMASCSTGPDRATPRPPTTAGGPRIVLAAALVGGQSCDDLLAWLRAEARTRVGPYGFDGGVVAYEAMEDMALPAAGAQRSATNEANADAGFDSPPSTAAPAPDSADGSTVGTNNQESGVDEIDRFKTDGRRVVMTDGQRLMAIDISGESPRLMGVVDLPMSGARLFLDGDRVLAVGAALYEEVPAS